MSLPRFVSPTGKLFTGKIPDPVTIILGKTIGSIRAFSPKTVPSSDPEYKDAVVAYMFMRGYLTQERYNENKNKAHPS